MSDMQIIKIPALTHMNYHENSYILLIKNNYHVQYANLCNVVLILLIQVLVKWC